MSLSGRLLERSEDQVRRAEEFGEGYDGCILPSRGDEDEDKKKKLTKDVKRLARDFYRENYVDYVNITAPRLTASQLYRIVPRKTIDPSALVNRMLYGGTEIGVDLIGSITGAGPGAPTGSNVHGATAELRLVQKLERDIQRSRRGSVVIEGIEFDRIDRPKGLIPHNVHGFIAGEPDGILRYGGHRYLLEIKSTDRSNLSNYISHGQLVCQRTRYQVISLMEIFYLPWCLVLVTTDGGQSIRSQVVIRRAKHYFESEMLPELERFYIEAILPEVVHPMRERRGGLRKRHVDNWVELPQKL